MPREIETIEYPNAGFKDILHPNDKIAFELDVLNLLKKYGIETKAEAGTERIQTIQIDIDARTHPTVKIGKSKEKS